MQVFCAITVYNFYITGLYDSLCSTVRPMKYVESDVMRYNMSYNMDSGLVLFLGQDFKVFGLLINSGMIVTS